MKKLLIILTSCFTFLVTCLIFPAHASDIDISCDSRDCTSVHHSFFNQYNIYPGQSFSKTLTVHNKRSGPCLLRQSVHSNTPKSSLPQLINISINRDSVNIFSNSLKNLFDSGRIDLGTVSAHDSSTYFWNATFSPNAGNNFQNKKVKLDLKLNFTCNEIHPPHWWSVIVTPRCSSSNNKFDWEIHNFDDVDIPYFWESSDGRHQGKGQILANSIATFQTPNLKSCQAIKIFTDSKFRFLTLNPNLRCRK